MRMESVTSRAVVATWMRLGMFDTALPYWSALLVLCLYVAFKKAA